MPSSVEIPSLQQEDKEQSVFLHTKAENILQLENESGKREPALVERARSGDQEAFGELVRMHRAQAYRKASTFMNDRHLAEDIVQDALIRAFLQLHQLVDPGRFRPWLNEIIKNQALMKLRRGGVYAKETPLSALPDAEDQNGGRYGTDMILDKLNKAAAERAAAATDPEVMLIRQEALSAVRQMLHILTPRERKIFEAYFFKECDPKEIAIMMDTTPANVYNSLSRSRQKVRRERIRLHISAHIQKRGPRKNILPAPHDFKGDE